MRSSSDKHYRRSIRLKDHNYTQAGAYFITVCTYGRQCVLGNIIDGEMQLNAGGEIVQEEWFRTSIIRSRVELDAFVIMPNHVHGIVVITDIVGAQRAAPLHSPRQTSINVAPRSLGAIVRSFKSASTKRVNEMREAPGMPLWQRNYYEHVVRDENEWNRIREYIATNPVRWAEDVNNPAYKHDAKERRFNTEFEGVFTDRRGAARCAPTRPQGRHKEQIGFGSGS